MFGAEMSMWASVTYVGQWYLRSILKSPMYFSTLNILYNQWIITSLITSFHILMNPSFDAVTRTTYSSALKQSTAFTLKNTNLQFCLHLLMDDTCKILIHRDRFYTDMHRKLVWFVLTQTVQQGIKCNVSSSVDLMGWILKFCAGMYLVSWAVNSQSHCSVPTSHSLTFSSSPAIARMEFYRAMVTKYSHK